MKVEQLFLIMIVLERDRQTDGQTDNQAAGSRQQAAGNRQQAAYRKIDRQRAWKADRHKENGKV